MALRITSSDSFSMIIKTHGNSSSFFRAHLNKLISYCETGVKEGAKLVYGGKRVQRVGLFFEPTIFTDVSDDMMIAKEESFGPVMIISKFKDE